MKAKILIIDDEPYIIDVLRETLESNYEIMTACNGKEGLEKIRSSKPDLVLSDINMPILTGIEMLEQLRKENDKTSIVFVSAFSDIKNIRKAWQLGAVDFIDKPFTLERIKSTVRMALMYNSDKVAAQVEGENIIAKTINDPDKVTLLLSKAFFIELSCEANSRNISIEAYLEQLVKSQKKAA